MDASKEAFRMIDTFTSVGTTSFDRTILTIDGEKRGFRARQSPVEIKNSVPLLMPGLKERQDSLVIRPSGHNVTLVQLDDLDSERAARVSPVAFLTVCTSPGNHQAWVAVDALPSEEMKDFARRLRKGAGADPSASGAMRVAGTTNFKRKYESDFPTVTITQCAPGRVVGKEKLEDMGLIAAKEVREPSPARYSQSSRARGVWPSYERCLQMAPLNHAGDAPDVSNADFKWCMTAYDWHWPVESIIDRLQMVSEKAKAEGERYARRTAEKAAAAVDARTTRRTK